MPSSDTSASASMAEACSAPAQAGSTSAIVTEDRGIRRNIPATAAVLIDPDQGRTGVTSIHHAPFRRRTHRAPTSNCRYANRSAALVARRALAQLALQRTAMHRQRPRRGRDIAVVIAHHVADVFPLRPTHRHRLRSNWDAIVAAIAVERRDYLVHARRLRHIVGRAELDGLDRGSDAGIGGQDYNSRPWVEREKLRNKLQPRIIGQIESDHGMLRRIVIDETYRLLSGVGELNVKPARGERLRQVFAQRDVVVDEQQARSAVEFSWALVRHGTTPNFFL